MFISRFFACAQASFGNTCCGTADIGSAVCSISSDVSFVSVYRLAVSVDLNVHMNLFQGDSDQRFVTRIWLDYEKQNECE